MKNAFAALLAFLALLAGQAAVAQTLRPVVVELFTSQGCSSCPPADALLGKLATRKDLIAMSLPITYWDMLGWKDTLASEDNTRRQKAYAATMGRGGVYTPQIIVEGTADVVGSQSDAVLSAIAEAERRLEQDADAAPGLRSVLVKASESEIVQRGGRISAQSKARELSNVGIALSWTAHHVHIVIAPAGKNAPEATIWAFRLRPSITVAIGAGENAGRTMTYRNVVSEIRNLGHWKGKPVSLDLPRAPDQEGVVVVLQQGGYGRVIGAAYLARADAYAEK